MEELLSHSGESLDESSLVEISPKTSLAESSSPETSLVETPESSLAEIPDTKKIEKEKTEKTEKEKTLKIHIEDQKPKSPKSSRWWAKDVPHFHFLNGEDICRICGKKK